MSHTKGLVRRWRSQARRNTRAAWRDFRVLVRRFRVSLLVFALLVAGLTLLLHQTYPSDAVQASWLVALYEALKLLFFNSDLPLPGPWPVDVLFILAPYLNLILVGEGVLRFAVTLVNRQDRREEWDVSVASTYQNHIVVCGLGKIGYRIVDQLIRMGEEVIAIELDPHKRFIEATRDLKVPIILGDAREASELLRAGVNRAATIVPCTSDDFVNLAIALHARDLNPQIDIVIRLFDDDFAARVAKAFNIRAAFSTSGLAAPAFAAAATRANVNYSFYVDDNLLNVSQVRLAPGSHLIGKTVSDIEKSFDLTVILYRGANGLVDLHPAANLMLAPNDTLVVFASLAALAHLTTAVRGR